MQSSLPACRFDPSRWLDDSEGSVAVEFAVIAPVLFLFFSTIIMASLFMATMNGLEQLTAGAARSSVAGLSDTERVSLATAYVTNNAPTYPYLDPTQLQVSTSPNPAANQFTVQISYNLATNKLYQVVKSLVPVTPGVLTRQAVAIEGGS